MKKGFIRYSLAMMALAGLLSGCAQGNGQSTEGTSAAKTEGTSSKGGEGTVKIAVAGPMTGDNSEYGIGFTNAAKLMADQWNAQGVVLGKHNARRFGGEPYNSVAFNKKMTYFELDNWDDLYARFGDDVWEINKSFLDQQWKAGKEFYFSHNPWNASILGGAGNSFEKEVSHLIYLGVKDFVPSGNGLWRAVR